MIEKSKILKLIDKYEEYSEEIHRNSLEDDDQDEASTSGREYRAEMRAYDGFVDDLKELLK